MAPVDAGPNAKLTQVEISKTVEFRFKAMTQITREQKEALIQKLKSLTAESGGDMESKTLEEIRKIEEGLSADEQQVLTILRARRILRTEDVHTLVTLLWT